MATKKPIKNAARKRQLVIAGGVITLSAAAFMLALQLAGPEPEPKSAKAKKPDVTRLDSPGTQATTGPSYEAAIGERMAALQALVEQSQVDAEKRQQQAIEEALKREAQKREASQGAASTRQPQTAPSAGFKVFDPTKLGQTLPPTEAPKTPPNATNASSLTTIRFSPPGQVPGDALASSPGNASSGQAYSLLTPNSSSEEAYRNVGRTLRGENVRGDAATQSSQQIARNTETYLPSGTFFQATNLNGLDAPTGGQAQNNPVPMLLAVTSMGQLPNKFKADVKQCFITAAGWGDLSAERAYIRTESLSCVRRNGDVVDIPIQGYVVGGDGKVGLRGRVVSKQGQVLANALWVSMLASFGEVSKAAATTVNVSSAGTITAGTGQQSTSDLLRQGALSGLGEAAKTLSNYYISLAEKLWPVIEVDPGQSAEIVLSRGSSLLQQSSDNGPTGLASISEQVQNTAQQAFGGLQGLSSISPTVNFNLGLGK